MLFANGRVSRLPVARAVANSLDLHRTEGAVSEARPFIFSERSEVGAEVHFLHSIRVVVRALKFTFLAAGLAARAGSVHGAI